MREERDRQWHNNEIVNRIGHKASLLLQLTDQPTNRPFVRSSVRPTNRSTDQTTMSALHQLRTQLRRLQPNVKLNSLLIISTSSLFIQSQYMNFCHFFLLQFLAFSLSRFQSPDCFHQFVLFMLPHILFTLSISLITYNLCWN